MFLIVWGGFAWMISAVVLKAHIDVSKNMSDTGRLEIFRQCNFLSRNFMGSTQPVNFNGMRTHRQEGRDQVLVWDQVPAWPSGARLNLRPP
jgi:hypothetical protein